MTQRPWRSPGAPRAALGAAFVFLVIAGIATFAAVWIHGDRLRQLEHSAAIIASQARSQLAAWFDARLGLMEALAERWPRNYAADPEAYREDAMVVIRRLPGLLALNWVDATGVIRTTVPVVGNEVALGSNLFDHPEPNVRHTLEQAVSEHVAVRTGTIELLQGGTGFAVYLPTFGADGSLQGFVNGVIRAQALIETSRLAADPGEDYRLELRDLDGTVAFSNSPSDGEVWRLQSEHRLVLLGREWTLLVAPTAPTIARAVALPQIGAFLGISYLLAALLAAALSRRILRQERLRSSERGLRDLLDLLPHPVYVKDGEGRFSYVNQALADACGTTPETLLGAGWGVLDGDPEDIARLERADREVMETGHSIAGREESFTDAAGNRRRLETARLPFQPSTADRPGVLGIGIDVTARHEAEALRAKVTSALDQAGEAITVLDVTGRILFANPAFVAMMGHEDEDVRGLRMDAFAIAGSDDQQLLREINETLGRGETWKRRYVSTWSDGDDRVRDATVTPVRDDTGRITGFIGVLRDVTREQALEQELRHSQKLEAVGRLSGGIAHDFNNLLTVILGYTETLRAHVGEDGPAAVARAEIEQAAERASTLTRQLLTFSRRRTTETAVADLNGVIHGLTAMVSRLIGEDIAVELDLDDGAGLVAADSGEIEQIVVNLCVNARDAMQAGGRIVLRTRVRDSGEPPVGVRPRLPAGTYVILSVADDGSGMAADVQDRAFEPFFTTKEVGAGTGLGLSTVYGIAEQRGGGIRVHSTPGRGTTLEIWLPRGVPEEAAADAPEEEEEVVEVESRAGATILVVEDEPGIRRLMTLTLERAGYRVHSASDGREACELARSLPRIDLLVSDVVMPHMGGLELHDTLAPLHPQMRVLFVSGYAPDERTGRPAAEDLLEKPFRARTLLAEVAARLGG